MSPIALTRRRVLLGGVGLLAYSGTAYWSITERIMRAEEAANKIPTKMTLGTMLFTVPPLLIILVGPSVHDMMENFAAIGGSP